MSVLKNTRLTTTPLPSPSTVYTFKTSPCMPAPRAHVENTRTRGAGTHGVFQRVTHHTHHTAHTTHHTPHTTPQPTITTRPPHHTETDRERDRQRERQTERERDRDRKRKRKKTEKEDRERRQRQREEIHFQCGGAWPFLVDGVLCLVHPVSDPGCSMLNRVKYDCSLISFSASWQVNSFFTSASYLIYSVTVFNFYFFELWNHAVTVSTVFFCLE